VVEKEDIIYIVQRFSPSSNKKSDVFAGFSNFLEETKREVPEIAFVDVFMKNDALQLKFCKSFVEYYPIFSLPYSIFVIII
jgi:hypothetical protein